jgi:ribosomal protein S18 acetylase RimI-like enzyme
MCIICVTPVCSPAHIVGVASARIAMPDTEGRRSTAPVSSAAKTGGADGGVGGGDSGGGGGWFSWLWGAEDESAQRAAMEAEAAKTDARDAGAAAAAAAGDDDEQRRAHRKKKRSAVPWGPALAAGRCAYLMALGVDAPLRRAGIARKLLDALIFELGRARSGGELIPPPLRKGARQAAQQAEAAQAGAAAAASTDDVHPGAGNKEERRRGDAAVPDGSKPDDGKPRLPFDWLLLHVLATNTDAIAFYEQCGFVRDGVEPGYYSFDGAQHDAVRMSLHLKAPMFEAPPAPKQVQDPVQDPVPAAEQAPQPVAVVASEIAQPQALQQPEQQQEPREPQDSREPQEPREPQLAAEASAALPTGEPAKQLDLTVPPVGFPQPMAGGWLAKIPMIGACMAPSAVGEEPGPASASEGAVTMTTLPPASRPANQPKE